MNKKYTVLFCFSNELGEELRSLVCVLVGGWNLHICMLREQLNNYYIIIHSIGHSPSDHKCGEVS